MQSMRLARVATVVCLIPAAAFAAGCGDGSKDNGKAGSDSEFRSEVDNICKDTTTAVEGLDPSTPADAKKVQAAIKDADKRLRELKVSEDVQKKFGDDYTAFYANFAKQAQLIDAYVTAVGEEDTATADEASGQLDALDKESTTIAKRMGLTECAKS